MQLNQWKRAALMISLSVTFTTHVPQIIIWMTFLSNKIINPSDQRWRQYDFGILNGHHSLAGNKSLIQITWRRDSSFWPVTIIERHCAKWLSQSGIRTRWLLRCVSFDLGVMLLANIYCPLIFAKMVFLCGVNLSKIISKHVSNETKSWRRQPGWLKHIREQTIAYGDLIWSPLHP